MGTKPKICPHPSEAIVKITRLWERGKLLWAEAQSWGGGGPRYWEIAGAPKSGWSKRLCKEATNQGRLHLCSPPGSPL